MSGIINEVQKIFQPQNWMEYIRKFDGEPKGGQSIFPKKPNLTEKVTWFEKDKDREIPTPDLPGGAGDPVAMNEGTEKTANPLYFRKKKIIPVDVTDLLDEAVKHQDKNLAAAAKDMIDDNVQDLIDRKDRMIEDHIWKLFNNTSFNVTHTNGQVIAIASGVPTANIKATVGASWETSTTDIVADLVTGKRTILESGAKDDIEVWMNSKTFAATIIGNSQFGTLSSEAVKNEIMKTGRLKNFFGFDFVIYDATYTSSGTVTRYIPDDRVHMVSRSAGRLAECKPSDKKAPKGWTGTFSKNWTENDPSGTQYLVAWRGLPVLVHPGGVYTFTDVTAT